MRRLVKVRQLNNSELLFTFYINGAKVSADIIPISKILYTIYE
jgi:hypothetical protein